MLLSKQLLSKLNVNFSTIQNDDLVAALNAIGIEVEAIQTISLHPNIKVGKLLKIQKHQNSDNLNICEVAVGTAKTKIVCGAKNLKENQWVVVATNGAILPDGKEIVSKEIRGVLSNGMLCGLEEISPNLANYINDDDKSTIIQIPTTVKINQETFLDDFGFNDTIFDISIPSNRPELNGLQFLAYELNLQFNSITTSLHDYGTISKCFSLMQQLSDKIVKKNTINVKLSDNLKINYFLAKLKINLSIEDTWKLKMYLIHSGYLAQANINDVATLTTVLFSTPVNIFSTNAIEQTISVEELNNEVNFVDNNQKTWTLKTGTIVTKNDNNQIVTLPGLYTNATCSVKKIDEEIYCELAHYNIDYFLNFQKIYNLNNNLTSYFLKNPNKNVFKIALSWLAYNKHFFSTKPEVQVISTIKSSAYKIVKIKSYKDIFKILGTKIPFNKLIYIFKKIGIVLMLSKLFVPSYRNDLNNIYDIVEEVLKYLDINQILVSPITFQINNFHLNKNADTYAAIRDYLVSKQFCEVKTYNLTNLKKWNLFNWFNINKQIIINNPISTERQVLRNNLVHELLNVLAYNEQHNQPLTNIFEIQKIQTDYTNAFNCLTCLLTTNIFVNPLNNSEIKIDDYSAKGLLQSLQKDFKLSFNWTYNSKNLNSLYDNNNVVIYDVNNNIIGVVGKIKANVLGSEYKLKCKDVYVLSLNIDELFINTNKFNKSAKISELNPIYKDLTFNNPQQIDLEDILEKINKIEHITNVELKNVFNKNNDQYYTITLTIQPENNNFTTSDIGVVFNNAINLLVESGFEVKNSGANNDK